MNRSLGIAQLALLAAGVARPAGAADAPPVVRVGHFPNITHAQALVGKATGAFGRALAPAASLEWKVFNAGPSAIEALFAGAIDLVYIGPSPAISGFVRSDGEALRIVAGCTSGGAALVVRADAGIARPQDFRGKKIASPQLGNTQDVALRAWLRQQGLAAREQGGDVTVLPIANPDQLTLFARKQIDAAWAPEPWASRLLREADGKLFFDERDLWPDRRFVTALLVVRTGFLREHRDLVKRWLRTHVELTEWIIAHQGEAKRIVNQQIRSETGKALPEPVLDDSFARLQATHDPISSSLLTSARWAFEAGLLGRRPPDLSGIHDLSVLNEVLSEREAPTIR